MGKKSKTKDVSISEELGETSVTEQDVPYEERLKFINAISKPMASKSQTKKIYKLIRKASKIKTFLRPGLKEVQRRIRLGEKGIVIFAGDVSPIEVMCHMPGVCEGKNIPYCYTPSRDDIGARGLLIPLMMVPVTRAETYGSNHLPRHNIPDNVNIMERWKRTAMGTKRGTIMVMVRPNEAYQENYEGVLAEIKSLPIPDE